MVTIRGIRGYIKGGIFCSYLRWNEVNMLLFINSFERLPTSFIYIFLKAIPSSCHDLFGVSPGVGFRWEEENVSLTMHGMVLYEGTRSVDWCIC